MMREVVRALETGPIAEIGVIAFFVAFILIVLYAFLLPKKKRDDAKNMPLDD
jgi:cbb3-type cytochrome oxidase subunit 3